MALKDTLQDNVSTILNTAWDVRDGNVVPTTDDVKLKDGAVKIKATFLYADLAESSLLAQKCPWDTTAKIIRAYLDCCVRIIRSHNGEIRSFDGDRVMGVFKTNTPNNDAVTCARKIFWSVENILNPEAKKKFNSISSNNIHIKNCVGIDNSEARAVRAGIRANNDLIWIGRAPSLAAKLSDIREFPYCVYISHETYRNLVDSAKKSGGVEIWEQRSMKFAGEDQTVYRTKYMLEP